MVISLADNMADWFGTNLFRSMRVFHFYSFCIYKIIVSQIKGRFFYKCSSSLMVVLKNLMYYLTSVRKMISNNPAYVFKYKITFLTNTQ